MRKPVPDKIANPPPLPPGCELFVTAYFELDTERRFPGGRIPYSTITSWCDENGIDDREQRQLLHEHVKTMDLAYLQWAAEKQAKANKQPEPPSSGK